ncbi:NAD(P)-dependent oxidoreductase [Paeniroseomonas aquatica]|uniref:NAD(P)-dependent oxidoreductase n=1 Tax=Paeniroseomonas aquatica TaxID=373043 RepID=UPI0036210BCF
MVGLGNLGTRVAKVGAAFGMKVIGWSQNLTAEKAAAAGATAVDKATLMAEADVVSMHLVLSDRSRGIIGAADLARMKKTAVIVNTSRGPLIDQPSSSRRCRKAASPAPGSMSSTPNRCRPATRSWRRRTRC